MLTLAWLSLYGPDGLGPLLGGGCGTSWGKEAPVTLALFVLALGTFLLRFLPWRAERGLRVDQAGLALVVALFLVSVFGPPPPSERFCALLALLINSLGARFTGNLSLAVFLGTGLYV